MASASTSLLRSLGCLAVWLVAAITPARAQAYGDGFDPNSDSNVYAMVRQPDGKIIVGGAFSLFEPDHYGNIVYRQRIARILRDGTVDGSFTTFTDGDISAMALQPDGRILIAGKFTRVGDDSGSYDRNGLARLMPNGAVDTTFRQINPVGVGAPPYAHYPQAIIRAIALQPDGRILIGGAFISLQPDGAGAPIARSRIARLNPDGSVDASFDVGANNTVFALLVEPDGDVVIGGGFTTIRPTGSTTAESRSRIARVRADGTLDAGLTHALDDRVLVLAGQADGKILVGGDFTTITPSGGSSTTAARLVRFNADGSHDSGFTPFANASVESITVQADGRLVVAGRFLWIRPSASSASAGYGYITRLFMDGTIDSEFFPNANGPVTATVAQPDGTIVAAGYFTGIGSGANARRGRIARLQADGTVDMAFRSTSSGSAVAIEREASGSLLIAGTYSTIGGVTRTALARISPEGVVSSTFRPQLNGPVYAVRPLEDGRILIGGGFTRVNSKLVPYFARLSADGEPDEAFKPNPNSVVYAITPQADGRMLIGGNFTSLQPNPDADAVIRRYAARINVDGTVDTAFDPSPNLTVNAIAIDGGGKILMAGDFTSLQPNGARRAIAYYYVVRLGADGTPDDTFLPRPNAAVSTLMLESDGKITLAGSFTAFLPNKETTAITRTYFARLNADGSVDTSFDARPNAAVYNFDRYTDGRYVIFGPFTQFKLADDTWIDRRYTAWLTPQGALDAARVQTPSAVPTAVRVMPDQSTFISGELTRFTSGTGKVSPVASILTRIDAAGQVDASFSIAPGDLGGAYVGALAVPVGGRLFAGGSFSGIGGSVNQGIVRLAADGTADGTFSAVANGTVHGIVALETTEDEEEAGGPVAWLEPDGSYRSTFSRSGAANLRGSVYAAVVQEGGRVVLGGEFTNTSVTSGAHLARLNSDGSADTSFNPRPDKAVQSVALLPDGRMIIAGNFTKIGDTSHSFLARLSADGTLDTTWAPTPDGAVMHVLPQSDGSVLVAGMFTGFNPNGATTKVSRGYAARINADGTVDTAFNPEPNYVVSRLAVQPDGKILLAGYFTTVKGKAREYLARVDNRGALDETFYPKPNDSVDRIALLSSGALIVGGRFSSFKPNDAGTPINRRLLARLNANGTVDEAFDAEPNNVIGDIALRTDGSVVIAGSFTMFQVGADDTVVRRNRIARFNADGTLDQLFNPNANGTIYTVNPRSDGSMLIGGSFDQLRPTAVAIVGGDFTTISESPTRYLARLNQDGSADAFYTPQPDAPVRALAEQSDGRLLVAGEFTTIGSLPRTRLARLDASGSPDPAFEPVIDGAVHALAVQPDDRVLIGGEFATVGGASRAGLARVLASGGVDPSFNASTDGAVSAIAVQPDGRIIVAGAFTQVNGTNRAYLARLAADGTLDSGFAPVLDAPVHAVAVQADGAVLIGGAFTTVGTASRARLARLRADGTLDTAFDVPVNGDVHSLLVLADGRVVLGGAFTQVGDRQLLLTARLANPTPAVETGALTGDLSTFTWTSAGSSPQFTSVEIARSDDGKTWTNAGIATRTAAGAWQFAGLSGFAENKFNHIRARAVHVSGGSGSVGRLEYTWAFYGARIIGPSTQLNSGGALAGWTSQYWNSTVGSGSSGPGGSGSGGTGGSGNGGTGGSGGSGGSGSGNQAAYHLVNLSVRAWPEDDQPLIAGLVITGQSDATVLMRGVGPGLTQFGVEPVMSAPRVTLFDRTGSVLSTASSWTGNSAVTETAAKVGAFPLEPDSDDSAVVRTLSPGAYTIHVDAGSGFNGVALSEIYFAGEDGGLANFSARAPAGAGSAACIAGFVVGGDQPRRLLVRGVGPTLRTLFAVADAVPDPRLAIYNAKGQLISSNDDWLVQSTASAADVAEAAARVGAFPLAPEARDAAVVVELPPGPYTVHVVGAEAGSVLAEIYEIPDAP